jgi:NAD(P)-dependent dehydrogenase (short-subunit alcohol dehydrogenase family)
MTENLFDLRDRVAVVTGGSGVLGAAMCKELAAQGVKVAVLGRSQSKLLAVTQAIESEGGTALGLSADVLDADSLRAAADKLLETFGRVDILINGAGGNSPQATVLPERPLFSLSSEAFQEVLNLNMMGTVLPTQVFGQFIAEQGHGTILNITSMAALRPLTRVAAYGSAKAAVANFTQWLAVYVAQTFGADIRVNAIAPGFFLTEQNRFLLLEQDGETLTQRGGQIIAHTPMGRFGAPEDLLGTMVWLLSDAAKFVTGIVVPVDGGFSAYSGV